MAINAVKDEIEFVLYKEMFPFLSTEVCRGEMTWSLGLALEYFRKEKKTDEAKWGQIFIIVEHGWRV